MNKIVLSLVIATSVFASDVWLEEADKRMNWNDAIEFCESKNAQLPTKKQFLKIWHKNNKASDVKGFDLSVSYWTSSVVEDNPLAAYPFYFMEGRNTWYYKDDKYGVRCIKK